MGGVHAGRGVTAGLSGGLVHRRQREARATVWGIVAASLALASTAVASEVTPGRIHRQYEDSAKAPRPSSDITLPSLERDAAPANADKIRFVLKGVDIDGNAALSDGDLAAPFASLIGQEVSLAQIDAAASEVTRLYMKAGYALSSAFVPAQEVKNGLVRIRVIEGFIDDVAFEDSRSFHSKLWGGFARRLMESRPLKTKDLERYLLLANDLAGVKVVSAFERMDGDPGATRLRLSIDRKMFDVRLSANNRGSEAIGPVRVELGGAMNGLLGAEERVAFFGVRTPVGEELAYLGGRIDVPLSSDGLSLGFDVARAHGRIGEDFVLIDYQTDGWVGKMMFEYPIIRSRAENFSASAGVTYKNLASFVFGGFENSRDVMTLLTFGADYNGQDKWGAALQASAKLYVGLGLFDATESGDASSRPGASGKFVRLEGTVSRLQTLERWPWMQLFTEVSAQIAGGALLRGEQCGYGGAGIGRAFDPYEISGDHCLKGLAEARYDLPVSRWADPWWINSAQVYGVADFGFVFNSGHVTPFEHRSQAAASLGLGLRMRAMEHVKGSLEVAQPIGLGVEFNDGKQQPRVFFGLSVDY